MNKMFTKMHGLGNDFLVFNCMNTPFELSPDDVKKLADRHFGVGCDQILVLEPPKNDTYAFHYRIFNANGSEVMQCGNGARCVARYAYDHKIVLQSTFKISTHQGEMSLQIKDNQQVTVNMGTPVFDPKRIPLSNQYQQAMISIKVGSQNFVIQTLSLGNPHAILMVTNLDQVPVEKLGAVLSKHSAFPEQCNIGFVEIVDPHRIKVRVYERGAAETLACGSGACAAMIAAYLSKKVEQTVQVELRGGTLTVVWKGGKEDPVLMTGPANYVFKGTILLS